MLVLSLEVASWREYRLRQEPLCSTHTQFLVTHCTKLCYKKGIWLYYMNDYHCTKMEGNDPAVGWELMPFPL